MVIIQQIRQSYARSRSHNGQSMVEMALMMPLLFLLILGIIEFGWYIYSSSEISNATRFGTELASKSPPATPNSRDDDTSDMCAKLIKAEIKKHAFRHTVTDSSILMVYPQKPLREIGIPVEITVRYTGPWLTPLGNLLFNDTMRLTSTSRRTIVNTTPPEGMKEGCIP